MCPAIKALDTIGNSNAKIYGMIQNRCAGGQAEREANAAPYNNIKGRINCAKYLNVSGRRRARKGGWSAERQPQPPPKTS